MRRGRETPAHLRSGVHPQTIGIFFELAGDGAPAIVEAHLLVRLAVGFVLVESDRLVGSLAVARVLKGHDRRHREGLAAFAGLGGPKTWAERACPSELLEIDHL